MPRWTQSWCMLWPRPASLAAWRSSLRRPMLPTSTPPETDALMRVCLKLHGCCTWRWRRGDGWRPPWCDCTSSSPLWRQRARPTPRAAGRRSASLACRKMSSGSLSYAASTSLCRPMSLRKSPSSTNKAGTLTRWWLCWKLGWGWSGRTWASSRSWESCMPSSDLRNSWSTSNSSQRASTFPSSSACARRSSTGRNWLRCTSSMTSTTMPQR
mmetsp:Transcript_22566/g.31422  ORF Transcript_22566/g.31422 Transcript_22566/m.31422 type:complete len:212 (+) Transcript_22566:3690-4325(+)